MSAWSVGENSRQYLDELRAIGDAGITEKPSVDGAIWIEVVEDWVRILHSVRGELQGNQPWQGSQ